MSKHAAELTSYLFTLRLWEEPLGEGHTEWRVKVQNVTSGKTQYFREWPTLIHLLLSMLPEGELPPENEARAIELDASP
jgi:hypothetical protein